MSNVQPDSTAPENRPSTTNMHPLKPPQIFQELILAVEQEMDFME